MEAETESGKVLVNIHPSTAKLIKKHNIDVDKVVKDFIESWREIKEAAVQIEYEDVVIRVPKAIMDFLRSCEQTLESTAIEYIEHNIIGLVRADLDAEYAFAPSPEEIVKKWNLNPIFKQLINDPFPES